MGRGGGRGGRDKVNHQTLRQGGFVRLIITIQWVKEGEGRREEGVEERRRRRKRRRRRRRKHAGESKRPPPAPLAVGLALIDVLPALSYNAQHL